MSEQLTQLNEQQNETQEDQITEEIILTDSILLNSDDVEGPVKPKNKVTKKQLVIGIGIGSVILAAIIAIILVSVIPSKFEKVENEALEIAGIITGGDDYFTIDTYPDHYEDMDEAVVAMLQPLNQKNALKAIKYVNEALGFNGSLYTRMIETNSIMGRQSEENSKYKVSWTYHPDDGLEVTYEEK